LGYKRMGIWQSSLRSSYFGIPFPAKDAYGGLATGVRPAAWRCSCRASVQNASSQQQRGPSKCGSQLTCFVQNVGPTGLRGSRVGSARAVPVCHEPHSWSIKSWEHAGGTAMAHSPSLVPGPIWAKWQALTGKDRNFSSKPSGTGPERGHALGISAPIRSTRDIHAERCRCRGLGAGDARNI